MSTWGNKANGGKRETVLWDKHVFKQMQTQLPKERKLKKCQKKSIHVQKMSPSSSTFTSNWILHHVGTPVTCTRVFMHVSKHTDPQTLKKQRERCDFKSPLLSSLEPKVRVWAEVISALGYCQARSTRSQRNVKQENKYSCIYSFKHE